MDDSKLTKYVSVYSGDDMRQILSTEPLVKRYQHAPYVMLFSFAAAVLALPLIWWQQDVRAGTVPFLLAAALLAGARSYARRLRYLHRIRAEAHGRVTHYYVTGQYWLVSELEELQRRATLRGHAIDAAILSHAIAQRLQAQEDPADEARRLCALAGKHN